MTRTQRNLLLLFGAALVVIIIIAIAFSSFGGAKANNDPKSVVEAAIKSIPGKDIKHTLQYFTPPAQNIMQVKLVNQYNNCDSFKVQNVRTYILNVTDISARISVSWEVVCKNGTTTMIDKRNATVKLIKNSGEWLINEAF